MTKPLEAYASEPAEFRSRPQADATVPLLARTDYKSPSMFDPANMLREARRQKNLGAGSVPEICLLDPDGDVADYVRTTLGATRSPLWACYHTELWEWTSNGVHYGVVGRAVGAPFAVLVAEQLFVSGCEFLVSLASAGRIAGQDASERYIVIDRALRDEGTSYHYLAPSEFAHADPTLIARARRAFSTDAHVEFAASWTTDAPFRETADAIQSSRQRGAVAVEMEAAALYAFGQARGKPLLCIAHLTNCLGLIEGDFEKGEANGAARSLAIAVQLASAAHIAAVEPKRSSPLMATPT